MSSCILVSFESRDFECLRYSQKDIRVNCVINPTSEGIDPIKEFSPVIPHPQVRRQNDEKIATGYARRKRIKIETTKNVVGRDYVARNVRLTHIPINQTGQPAEFRWNRSAAESILAYT